MNDVGVQLAGVDGCRGGWFAVVVEGQTLSANVVTSIAELLDQLASDAVVAIDIPIGLTDAGPRLCDVRARSQLGSGRASSVFPAPVRAVLEAGSYSEACSIREGIEGKRMSKQAFAILSKIDEVDRLLRGNASARARVREVHPEVCFWEWNGRQSMHESKKRAAGKAEREALINARWPGVHESLLGRWPRSQVARDDINDAFAALWTAERIAAGTAMRIPVEPEVDAVGLPMEMWA